MYRIDIEYPLVECIISFRFTWRWGWVIKWVSHIGMWQCVYLIHIHVMIYTRVSIRVCQGSISISSVSVFIHFWVILKWVLFMVWIGFTTIHIHVVMRVDVIIILWLLMITIRVILVWLVVVIINVINVIDLIEVEHIWCDRLWMVRTVWIWFRPWLRLCFVNSIYIFCVCATVGVVIIIVKITIAVDVKSIFFNIMWIIFLVRLIVRCGREIIIILVIL